MDVVSGPFAAASLLLAWGGAAKLGRPDSTARALSALRLPSSALVVRGIGMAEVGIAAGALAVGNSLFGWLVAGAYACFVVFVAAGLRRESAMRSCGCFGSGDTPPTVLHLVLVATAVIVAALFALSPAGGLLDVTTRQPFHGIPFLALTALCAWFAFLALTLLPKLNTIGSDS